MFVEDLCVTQHFLEEKKMDILSKVTHHTYLEVSLFYLVSTGQGDILAMGYPSKERDP